MTFSEIRQELINNAEEEFKNFTAKIVLTKMPMLGVRTPTVKKLAKEADESYLTRKCLFTALRSGGSSREPKSFSKTFRAISDS